MVYSTTLERWHAARYREFESLRLRQMKFKEKFKKVLSENQRVRKTVGVILLVVGIISIITPFTPVGFLVLVGLELLGFTSLFWEKIKKRFKKSGE